MDEINEISATTPWQKATASSGASGCVEFRRHHRKIQLRDSKLGEASPVLTFGRHEIECLMDGTTNGEFGHLLEGVD